MKFTLCWIIVFILSNITSGHRHNIDGFQHSLGHLKVQTSTDVQANAVQDLIKRSIGDSSKWFTIIVDNKIGPEGKDTFKISKTPEAKIEIKATSGVAAAWGFHYYLKNYCNCHFSWDGNQIQLPDIFPDVYVTVTSNDRFRYYQNVCTAGYSSTWWQWDQWEKNIDWMALNGFNLALAFHGQEAIWHRVYHELNFTTEEINEEFGGPAFLPWSRMGNMRGWGGPLSFAWHNHTITLQHKILGRMRDLGIIPILPAFAGHVPRAIMRVFPNANVSKTGSWNSFEDKYCCPYLLSPSDPLFKTLGGKFLRAYIDEFGTDHVYNCDTFNENEPSTGDLDSLKSIGAAIFSAMTAVDPQAIWIMQGWLFINEFEFWTEPRVEAFVTSVPIGKMIVLDLQSEQFPQYIRLKSYYGQPFIWCMLHNFGGTLGMFGSAEIINKRVIAARKMKGSTMIGTGLTPEGINQNYVIYELMNEMAYRNKSVDLDNWFENYSLRRYGAWNEYARQTWRILGRTIYDFTGLERIRGHYVITRRPSLKIQPWTWYKPDLMMTAWDNLVKAANGRANNTLYKHDLVDITRQALQLNADDVYLRVRDAFNKKNSTELRLQSATLLDLFNDLELILAASENFLLGKWLNDARLLGTNDDEKNLYEYNARNQITLWGPNGEILDYANKQWSGVMSDYFKARWSIFLNALVESVDTGKKFDINATDKKMFEEVEKPFTFSRKKYPTIPQGDVMEIAHTLNQKWKQHDVSLISKRFKKIRLQGGIVEDELE